MLDNLPVDPSMQTILSGLERVPMPMLVTDSSFNVTWANSYAQKQVPYLTAPDSVQALMTGYNLKHVANQLLESSQTITYPCSIPLVSTSLSFSPILDPEKQTTFFIVHVGLCNRKDDSCQNIEGANQMLFQFSASMRIPLTTIFSALSNAVSRLQRQDYETSMEMLEEINQRCFYMLKSCASITEFSRYSNGLTALRLQDIDVFRYLDDLLGIASVQLRDRGIQLLYDIPLVSLTMACDIEILSTVLASLISNAVAFVDRDKDDGQIIQFRARHNGNMLEISLSDNGLGIPAEVYPHIFEPYFTYGRDSENYFSAGLGLPLVKMMISLHQGRIMIQSQEQRGTNVFFSIPSDLPSPEGPTFADKRASDNLRNRYSNFNIFLADAITCPDLD